MFKFNSQKMMRVIESSSKIAVHVDLRFAIDDDF